MRYFLSILLLFFCTSTRAQVNLNSGLVLYLPFNGNTNDASGNGNNAVNYGATLTTDQWGNANSAYYFDGSSFMQIANNASLQPTSAITLAAKVKVQGFYNGTCYNNSIIDKGADFVPGFYNLRFQYLNGNCYLTDSTHDNYVSGFYNQNVSAAAGYNAPFIQKNQWDCLVFTYDGTIAKMYVNGVLRHQFTSTSSIGTNNSDVLLGKHNDPSYPYWFKGVMDEVRIYNRALNTQEVDALCNCSTNTHFAYAGKDTSVCLGGTTTLSASGGVTYSWSPTTGLGTPNAATTTVTPAAPTSYIVTVTNAQGCVDKDTVNVTITYTHFANAGKDTSTCLGGTASLTASGGVTYSWSPTTGLGTPNAATTTATPTAPTSYIITVTNAQGCIDKDTVNVAISYTHFANAGKDTSTCLGVPVSLTASGGVSYSWSPTTGLGTPNAATTTASINATTDYVVTVTNNQGCIDQDTVRVTLVPSPPITAGPKDTAVCKGSAVTLHASAGSDFTWTPRSAFSNPDVANPTTVITEPTSFEVTGKAFNGCISSATVHVDTLPGPAITITSDIPHLDCRHNSMQLFAGGAVSYQWQPAQYCDNATLASPVVTPPTDMLFTVTGTDINGCSGAASFNVATNFELGVFVPSAFSPNGDLHNDRIRPIVYCDFIFEEFLIFDRFGEKVFYSDQIENSWDGYFKGVPVPVGVYFYYVKGKRRNGDDAMIKGDITLIR